MIPFTVMRKLFFTLIYPFLTYGIEIWGHSSVTQLNRLDSKLNKSVTVIGKEPTRRENYIKPNTIPLRNECQYFTLIRVFKYYRLKHSLHYYRLFGTQEVRHNYNTRFSSNNNLNMPQIHSSKYKCSFYANGIKHWNNLPRQIKSARSKICFKRKLRSHLSNLLYIH